MIRRPDDLSDLTEPQREAVLHEEGPLLVVAGPGSGKTRVITRRVAHLVSRGINPAAILAITFTNKAAQEMSRRVLEMCPAEDAWIRTFHSTCAAILRRWPRSAELEPGFSIFDQKDQHRVIKAALDRLDIPSEEMKPRAARTAISAWKMEGTTPDEAITDAFTHSDTQSARIYREYERALRESNAVDFDDLLLRTLRALENDETLRHKLQYRFEHVLIDEYQDTNPVQFRLAAVLAERTRNICATGDPDQSIYAFRKADLSNILDFERHYPGAKVVRLEQNFRSVGNVLKAADALIAHNVHRHEKRLFTDAEDGPRLTVVGAGSELDEGQAIAAAVLEAYARGTPYKEVAVFYRTNAQSRAVEAGLRSRGIPYLIVKGVEFYQRAEVKDLLAYLKVLVNPRDWQGMERVLSTPAKGIGAKTLERIREHAEERELTPRAALASAAEGAGLARKAVHALRATDELLSDLSHGIEGRVAPLIDRLVTFLRYEDYLRRKFREDYEDRIDNVRELVAAAEEYDARADDASLVDFLTEVGLVSDVDQYDPDMARAPLMTLHTAKGLEFDEVIIAGLEEGLLPHVRSSQDAAATEEERRLLFVGITRARRRVTLTFALERRARIGSMNRESSFLRELPEEVLDFRGQAHGSRWEDGFRSRGSRRGGRGGRVRDEDEYVDAYVDADVQYGVDEDPSETLRVGLRVEHPTFGRGRVRRLLGRGRGARAVVDFDRRGEKMLALSFAKLVPVDD